MLQVQGIDTYYGPIQALENVCIEIGDREIVSIIGANGAGKSTLMKTLIGLCHPAKGTITFNGKRIETLPANKVVREGIVYVPEGRKILANMSVSDNLEMGAYSRKITRTQMQKDLESVYEIFPRLKEREKQLGGTLSGGEQQMLAIGRGLMADPKLLMLDEPSMGLAPIIVEEMFQTIKNISDDRKLPILLVEQNAFVALGISERCYVLENGKIALSGTSQELRERPEVKKSYLGG